MTGRRGSRGSGALRVAVLAALVVTLTGTVAGCVTTRNPFPAPGTTPQAPGGATAPTVARIVTALSARGVPATESNRAYRPAEGPLLAAAPRTVIQATLPEDPERGFILVYSLASSAAAQAAAEDHAAYLATGFGGGVQYPPGTEFVVRVVGADVVFFSWLPANAPDPRTATISEVLSTIGTGVPIPG